MSVRITKSGFRKLEWDGTRKCEVERPVNSFLECLRESCTIDDGVTLNDIFNAVEADPPLKEFIAQYSWCPVDEFHAEVSKLAADKSDLHCINISAYFEFDQHEGRVTIDCGGEGEPDEHGTKSYAIGFTPVSEIAHLPIRLSPEIEIRKDHEVIGRAPYAYSLLEVLDAIYFEISFYGGPESRDSKAAELRETMRKIESGEVKLVPFEAAFPDTE